MTELQKEYCEEKGLIYIKPENTEILDYVNWLETQIQALRMHDVSGWVAVTDALPKPLQTVWLTNGKGWVCLGCLIESDGGWHWAKSNGVIYIENGEIVSECESEDLDVNFWHELPKPPCLQRFTALRSSRRTKFNS